MNGHTPGHDARDPSLPLHQVRRNPLGALDALEEAAIDGRYAKHGCGPKKKRDGDESVGVGLEGQSGGLAALTIIALAAINFLCVWV